MQTMTNKLADEFYNEHRSRVFVQTDRLFAVLLALEWLSGIFTAAIVSPQTWSGSVSAVHEHVLAAILLGGLIVSLPIALVIKMPGRVLTRHTVAIAQMLYSGLFIHLTGGRIESHFHVFGSLAFLAFYRDWRVLVTASSVVAFDHSLRGLFWAQSVYGVPGVSWWRTLEHVGWVLFEDTFLIISCLRNQSEMREIAARRAQLETMNELVEREVADRTFDLQANVDKFRTLCELSPIAIFQADLDGNCTFVSKRWTELTGFTFDETKGLGWTENIHPDDAGLVLGTWGQCVEKAEHFAIEYRYICKSGEILWISSQARPITGGVAAEYVGTCTDITTKKAAEFATSQLADIVRYSHDAIYSLDLNDHFTSWNEAAERLYGYSADEIIGKHRSMLMTCEAQLAEAYESQRKMMIGSTPDQILTERRRKDGTLVQVEITISALRDRSEKALGISLIARDVTAKKEAEQRIAEFYSTVSHELRSPLTSIRGALTLINSGIVEASGEEGKELIGIATSSSDRLIRLINDILDLRKMEAGAMELQLQEIRASQIVRGAVDAMRGMASQAGIKLEVANQNDANIVCDHDRVTQVLTNYVSNAIKFAPGGSTVTISVAAEAGKLRFSVTDLGCGIPLEKQSRIFGKFQQADSSDSRAKEGTGLGLAISKAIIEQHGGSVGFSSRPHEGSVFWFDLVDFELIVPTPSTRKRPSRTTDLAKTRVLIVEDDEGLSRQLALGLAKEGYDCEETHSVSQALQYAACSEVDVFIVDLNLPDGSGVDVIESLRRDPKYALTPVIVITGDRRERHLPFVFDLLYKPFSQDRLLSVLERAVQSPCIPKVLIVDDDPGSRSVVCSQLKQLNVQFDVASNGVEALERIEHCRPDLLILDISMPLMNGFELLEELRKCDREQLALVVYSGQDLTKVEREKLGQGLTKYLTKGIVSEQEFIEAVSMLLNRVHTRSPKIGSPPSAPRVMALPG